MLAHSGSQGVGQDVFVDKDETLVETNLFRPLEATKYEVASLWVIIFPSMNPLHWYFPRFPGSHLYDS